MGLDMYLHRRVYLSSWNEDKKYQLQLTCNDQPTDINLDKVSYLVEEFGYWRKANAIHKWFVDNVQDGKDDCGEYYVSQEKLTQLKDICQRVLDNPHHGCRLLPTTSGFFFGGTGYGEHYLNDLAETIKICQRALDSKSGTFYYQSSW